MAVIPAVLDGSGGFAARLADLDRPL